MEDKSYPEMLHDIFVRFDYGDKKTVTSFERNIILLIDKMMIEERKRLLPNRGYLENKDIKIDCESCSRHDSVIGCRLKSKEQCKNGDKYIKYRRGHLLPCDKCKTYSVVTKIDKIQKNNVIIPAITFMCVKCKDHPMINGRIFRGYELRGMEFLAKYLQKEKQTDPNVSTDTEKQTDPNVSTDTEKQIDPNILINTEKQTDPNILIDTEKQIETKEQ